MILYSLTGVLLYALYIWISWSNQLDDGETKLSFKDRMYLERQELVITTIGALIFAWQGEGMLDSICDGVLYFFGDKAESFCVSVQVNMEELSYIIGGATFGSLGLFAVKLAKKRAKKKLDL